MKVIAIIPARYQSSRFPGKPLADICGKPMIWWVYNQVSQISEFDDVVVATDSVKIIEVCERFGIKTLLTKDNHPTHVHRIHEVSEKILSDYYVVVCGDEPLISVDVIKAVFPNTDNNPSNIYVGGLCRYFTDPSLEALSTNTTSNFKPSTSNTPVFMGGWNSGVFGEASPIGKDFVNLECGMARVFVKAGRSPGKAILKWKILDGVAATPGRARSPVSPERSEPRKRSLEVCAPPNLHALHVLHG